MTSTEMNIALPLLIVFVIMSANFLARNWEKRHVDDARRVTKRQAIVRLSFATALAIPALIFFFHQRPTDSFVAGHGAFDPIVTDCVILVVLGFLWISVLRRND